MAFGFCVLTARNCNSSLVHTLQLQLLLTGINHQARLRVSRPYSNLTFRQSGRTVLQNEGEANACLLNRNCSLAMSSAKHECGAEMGAITWLFCFLGEDREKRSSSARKR